MSRLGAVVAAVAAAVCAGCGTSIKVWPSTTAKPGEVHSAYLVMHNATPNDMDLKMQDALNAQHLTVTSGTSESGGNVDLVVKFDDHWRWDVAMYLAVLRLELVDGHSGALLATSQWSDGAMHGYRDSAKACKELVAETFRQTGIPTTEK